VVCVRTNCLWLKLVLGTLIEYRRSTVSLEDDLTSKVAEIFRDHWTTRDGSVVPEPKDIALGNDAVKMTAAILYADLRGSTKMVDAQSATFSAEVYKTYLHCAGKIILACEGGITAYDGDRVMAVFLGDYKRTNAARCALRINYAVKNIINPGIVNIYGSDKYTVQQIVGVDMTDILVARTGVWGNNDLVWVGSAANYAAKLCELGGDGCSSYLTHRVYDGMDPEIKTYDGRQIWENRTWTAMNKMSIYRSNWTWTLPD
jgi:class 3 adenylate cyclase